jgi:AcrR family transcriptional regulator
MSSTRSAAEGDRDATPLPRYLQLMWGVEQGGRRGPKPGRSIGDIGAAAVAVADRDGLAGVSMKSVATELGLTTMSLYRYVDSKDELYAVMLDTAYGSPEPSLTARGNWRTRLEKWARAIAAVRLEHPWTVTVPLREPPATPNTARWTESGLQAFAATKLSAQQRFSALLLIDGFVQHHIRQSLQLGFVSETGQPGAGTDNYPENLYSVADPQEFPHLLAGAEEAMDPADDDDFFATELDFGLRTILDGIAAQVDAAR